MYIGLCTLDTLHKKPCRIRSGLCGTSENADYAKFGGMHTQRGPGVTPTPTLERA